MSMLAAASANSDPFGGLVNSYRVSEALFPSGVGPKHPGKTVFPQNRTVGVPQIRASVATNWKKTNASIVYTRVTPMDSKFNAGKAEGLVFLSRNTGGVCGHYTNRRYLMASIDVVNKQLEDVSNETTLPAAANVGDDWRLVPKLREWCPDGVLKGLNNEENSFVDLNVCIEGVCAVRNVFDKERMLVLDSCYVMLVAVKHAEGTPDECWKFKYVPCTSRPLIDHEFYGTLMAVEAPSITKEETWSVVGGWRVGKVVDRSAVVASDQQTITLDVDIRWEGWRALREMYPDAGIGSNIIDCSDDDPLKLFNWPSFVDDSALEAPYEPTKSDAELKMDKNVVDNEITRQTEANVRCTNDMKKRKRSVTPTPTPPGSDSEESDDEELLTKKAKPSNDVVDMMVQDSDALDGVLQASTPGVKKMIEVLKDPSTSAVPPPVWFESVVSLLSAFYIQHKQVLDDIASVSGTRDVAKAEKLLKLLAATRSFAERIEREEGSDLVA